MRRARSFGADREEIPLFRHETRRRSGHRTLAEAAGLGHSTYRRSRRHGNNPADKQSGPRDRTLMRHGHAMTAPSHTSARSLPFLPRRRSRPASRLPRRGDRRRASLPLPGAASARPRHGSADHPRCRQGRRKHGRGREPVLPGAARRRREPHRRSGRWPATATAKKPR